MYIYVYIYLYIYIYIYKVYIEGVRVSENKVNNETFVMKEIFAKKYFCINQNIEIGNLLILTIVIMFWLELPFAVKLRLSCL